MRLPRGIDPECLALVRAMNRFPGIRTSESCCGHGKTPFRVFFRCTRLLALPPLLYWIDSCHSGVRGWSVQVYTDCSMCPARFYVEGPPGDFAGAKKIAATMNKKRVHGGR